MSQIVAAPWGEAWVSSSPMKDWLIATTTGTTSGTSSCSCSSSSDVPITRRGRCVRPSPPWPPPICRFESAAPPFEAAPAGDAFAPSLAAVLTRLVALSPAGEGRVTRFDAVKAPEISVRDYLERIQRYFGCSNECFVLSLVYIDRIVKSHEEFTVSILNIHRLLITAVMLAAKFFDDVYYSNAFYARVGGVRTKELNLLEWQFLALVSYHLYVGPLEYDQYRRNVLAAVNGIRRPVAIRDDAQSRGKKARTGADFCPEEQCA